MRTSKGAIKKRGCSCHSHQAENQVTKHQRRQARCSDKPLLGALRVSEEFSQRASEQDRLTRPLTGSRRADFFFVYARLLDQEAQRGSHCQALLLPWYLTGTRSQPKEEVFGTDIALKSGCLLARTSRVKSLSSGQVLEVQNNVHSGHSWCGNPCPEDADRCPWEKGGLKKLRSEKLQAELSSLSPQPS